MIGKILGKGCQYLLIRLNTSHYSLSAIIACKRMRSGMLGDILRHMKNELMNPRSSWSHGNYSHWQPFVIEVQGSFRFFLSLTVNYNLSSWLFPGIEDGLNHTFSSGKALQSSLTTVPAIWIFLLVQRWAGIPQVGNTTWSCLLALVRAVAYARKTL